MRKKDKLLLVGQEGHNPLHVLSNRQISAMLDSARRQGRGDERARCAGFVVAVKDEGHPQDREAALDEVLDRIQRMGGEV